MLTSAEHPEATMTSSSAAAADTPNAGNYEEQQYLDLVRHIVEKGAHRGDRTGTGTISGVGNILERTPIYRGPNRIFVGTVLWDTGNPN